MNELQFAGELGTKPLHLFVRFYLDNVVIMTVDPVTSFWDFGEFDSKLPGINNPWSQGDKLAPFDRPV